MKRCPECRRDYYDETLLYCLDDGIALVDGPASSGDHATVKLRTPDSLRGGAATEADTRLYTSGDSLSREIKRHKFGAVAIVGAALIVLSAAAYGIYRFLDKPEPARSNANMQTQRLTGDGKTRGAEISPDGKFLGYIRTDGVDRSIWIKQIQTNSNIQIVKPGELDSFQNLVFSPDGNFLYFNAESAAGGEPSVYRVPTLGGTPAKVLSNAIAVQFSPDGKQVSFGRFSFEENATLIMVANVDGSNERRVGFKGGTEFFEGPPTWSPDATMIAVAIGDDSLNPQPHMSVAVIRVDNGELRELGTKHWFDIEDLVWHPSGDSLILSAAADSLNQDQIWETSYPDGEVRRLTNNLNGYVSVSMTSDGRSIVTGELVSRSAVWVSPDTRPENAKPVMPNSGDTWGLSWTPDNRIVYASDQSGDVEIWIMDADGANGRPLTSDRVFKATPVASPDGKYVVYTSSNGGGQIVRIDINGGNPTVLSEMSGADNPDISLDSQWVIFSAWQNGVSKVFRVSINGGDPHALTNGRGTEPRYSRDGTRIACFIPNETTQNWTRLAIIPAEGGEPLKVFDAPPNTNVTRGPIWSPDDKGISVIISPGEQQNLWLQPVDDGPGKQMTNFDTPGIARREYSRDGKRIAIVRAQGNGNAIMLTDYR
jgi:TolB protein